MKAGIVGYGAYVPRWRLKAEEIAQAWQHDFEKMYSSLLIKEKAVPGKDEDTITLATAAAKNALKRAPEKVKGKIGAVYVGSESHPYAVKPSASVVGNALGLGNHYCATDMEFACKGGTAAVQAAMGLVSSKMVSYALAIGADTAQGEPGDVLEYAAGTAGAAIIVGNNEDEFLAEIEATCSFTSDTPDFWRRNMQKYPQHTGRFTAEPSYLFHTTKAAQMMCEKTGYEVTDFDYVIFHQPNGRFPFLAAKSLGIAAEKLQEGLIVQMLGNSYSACTLVGLCAVLDGAVPDKRILLVSYGSGSGSDALVLRTTTRIQYSQGLAPTVHDYVQEKRYISYAAYRRQFEMIY